jgi:DnaJ like chaperone protein
MSVIGWITSGARDLPLGGPLGALIERAARCLPRRAQWRALWRGAAPRNTDPRHSIGFTIAVIALGAKMAKADGTVTRDEVAAFREVFQVPPGEEAHLRLVFDLARKSTAGFESYARQIGRMFAGDRGVLEDLLGGLFHIALADGRLCPAEDAYLREVARHLGLDGSAYARLRALYAGAPGDGNDEAHAILSVAREASPGEIRAAHRRLVRAYHPDLLAGRGLPPQSLALATARVARINAARDRLLRNRPGIAAAGQPA